ncbi:hypothetical protein AB3X55_10030 [Alphaproteobacteria bacterium LSUCC0719]
MSKIKFQDVLRDAVQSLFGTNPDAQEIIDSYPTAHLTGTHAIQTGGGTFFDLFAKKRRNEWDEVEKLISHFRNLGVRQSTLIRGDFLFGYEPQPYDVIRALVFEYAAMGMNVLQNFHGLNDARCLAGVARAVAEAQAAGHDIIAQGTICIEDNPNVTVARCLAFADELVVLGHSGFYLKSASGRLNPYFVYELVSALYRRFPDQDVTIHAHSTYGEAPACYMAATLAAIEQDKDITMDVQHPALAGSTAQPSMNKMVDLIRNYPDERISSQTPKLDIDAIKASMFSLYGLRFRYREFESSYNTELVDAMYAARTPGGASATLKSIPGLVDNLGRLLGTAASHANWDRIQIAIYRMQAEILKDLGQPTQVTPYAANTTGQAALSLWHRLEGRDKYHSLYPGIADYLVGRHGRVPASANPMLVQKALDQLGLERQEDYVAAPDRPDGLPQAEDRLVAAGIANPTTRQKISATMLQDSGPFRAVPHVVACDQTRNVPAPPPEQPFYARPPQPMPRTDGAGVNRDVRDAVNIIGGYSKLQEIAERVLHIKQLTDHRYIFPAGEEDLEQEWFDSNIARLKLILKDIPVKLAAANFSEGQKMVMLDRQHPNSIHLAIKDAVDQKGAGLYDFMIGLTGSD